MLPAWRSYGLALGTCVAAAGLASVCAGAEDDGAYGGGPVQGERLVVTAEDEGEFARTDASGQTTAADQRLELDQRELVRDGVMRLGDLGLYDPRVTVVEDARGGVSDIRLRGLGGSRVLVTMDGIPLADDPAGRGYVDPNLLAGIDVSFGPGSLRSGSDAVAGSVDFRTLRPDDLVGPGEAAVLGRVFASSLDRTVGLHARAAGATARQGLLLGATVQERDEREAVGAADVPPQDIGTKSALASYQFDVLPAWRTTWTLDGYRERARTELRDGPLYRQQADDRRSRWRAALASDARLGDERRLRAQAAYQDTRSDETTETRDFFTDPIGFNRTISSSNGFRQRQVTADAAALAGRPDQTLVVAGVDARLLRSEDLQTEHTSTVSPPLEIDGAPTRSFPISETVNAGIHGEWRQALDERWAGEAGLRVDGYALDVTVDDAYERSLAGQNAPTDLQAVAPTGRLALLWSPRAEQVGYAKAATGYRNGRFDEANQAFTNFTNGYTISPNPDLEPERSVGLELGWRQHGDVAYELTAHATRYRDFIDTRYVGTVPNTAGIGPYAVLTQYQSVNRARVDIAGADATLDAGIGLGFLARGAVSWIEGRDRETGDGIDGLDPLRGSAGIGWQDAPKDLRIDLLARFSRAKGAVADGDAFVPPGWIALDLRLAWRLGSHAEVDAALVNLLDKRYWSWSESQSLRDASSDADKDLRAADARHATISFTAAW